MLVVPEAINSEATSVENATSVLLDLPGFRVADVRRVENEAASENRRLVVVETVEPVAACPGCGVLAGRVHERPLVRVKRRSSRIPVPSWSSARVAIL